MEGKTELQQIAIITDRKKQISLYQQSLDRQWLDSRMADGRMNRCLAQIRKEEAMEKAWQERTDHAAIVNAANEGENALGRAISKQKQDELAEVSRRQCLRERDDDLRTLINKLRIGYTRKAIERQIRDNEYRRLQEKAMDDLNNRILLESVYNYKEEEERCLQIDKEKKSEMKKVLLHQMQEQSIKKCPKQQKIQEKKIMDEILQTYLEEDMRELEKKQKRIEQCKKDMEYCHKMKAQFAEYDKHTKMMAQKELEKQQAEQSDRSSAIIAAKKAKLEAKERLNMEMGNRMQEEKRKIAERENIIKSLQEQEYLEEGYQDDMAEKRKTELTKKEVYAVLTAQMRRKYEEIEMSKEQDYKYRLEIEKQTKEYSEQEKAKAEKEREKKKAYAQDLKTQMEINRKLKQESTHMAENTIKALTQFKNDWDNRAEAERDLVVKEFGPQVLGYLQANVLKKSDIPSLRAGADEQGLDLDIESLGRPATRVARPKCNAQCAKIKNY